MLQFLVDRKLKGAAKNVVKTKTKEQLVDDYKELFLTKVSSRHIYDQFLYRDCSFFHSQFVYTRFKSKVYDMQAFKTDETEKVIVERTNSQSEASDKDVNRVVEKTKKLDIKTEVGHYLMSFWSRFGW